MVWLEITRVIQTKCPRKHEHTPIIFLFFSVHGPSLSYYVYIFYGIFQLYLKLCDDHTFFWELPTTQTVLMVLITPTHL